MSETDEDVCGCRGMGLRLYPYGGGPLAAGLPALAPDPRSGRCADEPGPFPAGEVPLVDQQADLVRNATHERAMVGPGRLRGGDSEQSLDQIV